MSLLFSRTQLEWDIILETVLFFVEELSAAGHEPWVGVEKKTPGYDIICFTHQASNGRVRPLVIQVVFCFWKPSVTPQNKTKQTMQGWESTKKQNQRKGTWRDRTEYLYRFISIVHLHLFRWENVQSAGYNCKNKPLQGGTRPWTASFWLRVIPYINISVVMMMS